LEAAAVEVTLDRQAEVAHRLHLPYTLIATKTQNAPQGWFDRTLTSARVTPARFFLKIGSSLCKWGLVAVRKSRVYTAVFNEGSR
jgi:hypothetical protein